MKRLTAILFIALVLSPVPALAAVRGVAISSEGVALPEVNVTAFALEAFGARRERILEGTERVRLASAVTNGEGRFSIDVKGVPAFDLVFSRPNHAPTSLRVTPNEDLGAVMLHPAEDPIRVTLTGSERVLARLLVPSGEPYLRSAWSFMLGFTLNPGTNVLTNILPGKYTLMVLDQNGQAKDSQSVEVTEGRTSDVKM